jgi:hypothetical protein
MNIDASSWDPSAAGYLSPQQTERNPSRVAEIAPAEYSPATPASFSKSGSLQKVQEMVEKLKAMPDVREDVVARATDLYGPGKSVPQEALNGAVHAWLSEESSRGLV